MPADNNKRSVSFKGGRASGEGKAGAVVVDDAAAEQQQQGGGPASPSSKGAGSDGGPEAELPHDDGESVYAVSDDDDTFATPGGHAADAAEAQDQILAKWAPVLYKRPIVPVEGAGRHCPPPMTASSLTAFSEHKKLVLFGGMMDKAPTNETWIYDMVTLKWSCLHEYLQKQTQRFRQHVPKGAGAGLQDVVSPPPRCGHAAVLVNSHEMILFGGADVSISKYYNDLWSFDIVNLQWTLIEAGGVKPRPRWVFAMAAVEERVYIHGGESPEYEVLGDLQVYDHDPYGELNCHLPCRSQPYVEANGIRDAILQDTKRVQGELAKRSFSLVDVVVTVSTSPQCIVLKLTVNTRLSETDLPKLHEAVAAILEIDMSEVVNVTPAARRWLPLRTINPCPLPRMMHQAAVVKDRMVIIGGSGGLEQSDANSDGSNTTWVLDARCLLWREIPIPPDAMTPFHMSKTEMGSLTGHVAAPYDNAVIVHGGKLNGRVLGDNLWILDMVVGRWHPLEVQMPAGVKKDDKGTYPNTRWKHTVTAIVDIDHTSLMRNARTITPGPRVYPLGNEKQLPQLRAILAQERNEFVAKYKYTGLLSSSGNIPHIVSTQSIILWGGQSQARKCSDLWQLTLTKAPRGGSGGGE